MRDDKEGINSGKVNMIFMKKLTQVIQASFIGFFFTLLYVQ